MDLKAIDTDKAPRDVQLAMTKLIVMVESNLHVRFYRGNVDAANDGVADAAKDLKRALESGAGSRLRNRFRWSDCCESAKGVECKDKCNRQRRKMLRLHT